MHVSSETGGLKWIDLKEFDSNKCISNSSKKCVLKVDLELRELHSESYENYATRVTSVNFFL